MVGAIDVGGGDVCHGGFEPHLLFEWQL